MKLFNYSIVFFAALLTGLFSCADRESAKTKPSNPGRTFSTDTLVKMAHAVENSVNVQMDSGMSIKVWAIDSMVADPVSLNIDDHGRLFYTRTNRQKH